MPATSKSSGPGAALGAVHAEPGPDPATGNRRQRGYTFDDLKDRRAGAGQADRAVAGGTFTERSPRDRRRGPGRLPARRRASSGKRPPACPTPGRCCRSGTGSAAASCSRSPAPTSRTCATGCSSSGRRRGGTPGTRLGARSVALTLGRLQGRARAGLRGRVAGRQPGRARPPARQAKRAGRDVVRGRSCARSSAAARRPAGRLLAAVAVRGCGAVRSPGSGGTPSTSTRARSRSGWPGCWSYGRVIVKTPKSERGFPDAAAGRRLAAALLTLRKRQAIEADGRWGRVRAGSGYGWSRSTSSAPRCTPSG